MLIDALTSLREHFGFTDFREGQREVIAAILNGKDAIVVMPTGSGKSVCYQLPAMMLEGATLVVSPLIALMKDQVDALRERDLPATFINSSISSSEQQSRIEALRRGQFKLIYIAPERFRSSTFIAALKSVRITLFAVDEAHCISTWGHDFRPDYLQLKSAIQSLGGPQTLALTATATPYVRTDIIQQLGLRNPETFVSGFDRPNLKLDVVHTSTEREKIKRIKHLAQAQTGPGIVYASTRKAVEHVAEELRWHGLSVAAYHAGMKDAARIKAQEDFMLDKTQIIVATNAFGMGIDKADIRFIAHYQMPGSIEAYYQEIGRAGRDGLRSTCVLLFNYADKNTHDFFIEGSYPDAEIIKDVYRTLSSIGQRVIELSTTELASRANVRNELAVQSALYLLERAGHIARSGADYREAARRARSIVLLDPKPVPKLRVNFGDVARRAEVERSKLREIIELCYSDNCYRAHILNYFGDRHHARSCGMCGNCAPQRKPFSDTKEAGAQNRPFARVAANLVARPISETEALCARKILAGAARMHGRFGKNMLIAMLRGSAAQNVMQAGLNELSTYGLLSDMRKEQIVVYVDALLTARCLQLTGNEYPTISITDRGQRVMREQEEIELPLPAGDEWDKGELSVHPARTALETLKMHQDGLSVKEIAQRRQLVTGTIESHLITCLQAGLLVNTSVLVSSAEREQIERAIAAHGDANLKPLKDALPADINYNMIRFVLAERALSNKAAAGETKQSVQRVGN